MLRPTSDSIVVEPVEAGATSPGGVVVPEAARGRYHGLRGLVLAVGPGAWTISGSRLPVSVKPGDVVLLARGGMIVREDGKELAVVQDRDVLAVVEQAPAPGANGLSPAAPAPSAPA